MGDHFCKPPAVWPSVKTNEITDAIRRKSVVVARVLTVCETAVEAPAVI